MCAPRRAVYPFLNSHSRKILCHVRVRMAKNASVLHLRALSRKCDNTSVDVGGGRGRFFHPSEDHVVFFLVCEGVFREALV